MTFSARRRVDQVGEVRLYVDRIDVDGPGEGAQRPRAHVAGRDREAEATGQAVFAEIDDPVCDAGAERLELELFRMDEDRLARIAHIDDVELAAEVPWDPAAVA